MNLTFQAVFCSPCASGGLIWPTSAADIKRIKSAPMACALKKKWKVYRSLHLLFAYSLGKCFFDRLDASSASTFFNNFIYKTLQLKKAFVKSELSLEILLNELESVKSTLTFHGDFRSFIRAACLKNAFYTV